MRKSARAKAAVKIEVNTRSRDDAKGTRRTPREASLFLQANRCQLLRLLCRRSGTYYVVGNLYNTVTTADYYVLQMFCFVFVWCPCTAINVSVQHNGGFLRGIILFTQCYYHGGTRSNAMKRF